MDMFECLSAHYKFLVKVLFAAFVVKLFMRNNYLVHNEFICVLCITLMWH